MKISMRDWFGALRGTPSDATHADAKQVWIVRQVVTQAAERYLRPVSPQVHERFMAVVRQRLHGMQPQAPAQPSSSAPAGVTATVGAVWTGIARHVARSFLSLLPSPKAWTAAVSFAIAAVGVLTLAPWNTANQEGTATGAVDGGDVIMRGGEAAQRLEVLDVEARVKLIESALRADGITPFTRRLGESISIQALVPAEKRSARATLVELDVVVADHGRLNVMVRRKQ